MARGRLRGDDALEVAKAEALQGYLEDTCGGLLTKLYGEWYDDAGALREPYAPQKANAKKRK